MQIRRGRTANRDAYDSLGPCPYLRDNRPRRIDEFFRIVNSLTDRDRENFDDFLAQNRIGGRLCVVDVNELVFLNMTGQRDRALPVLVVRTALLDRPVPAVPVVVINDVAASENAAPAFGVRGFALSSVLFVGHGAAIEHRDAIVNRVG